MPRAAPRSNVAVMLDVHHYFPAKLALDAIVFLYHLPQAVYLFWREIFGAFCREYFCAADELLGTRNANAVDIRKSVLYLFAIGDVGACDAHADVRSRI